MTSPPAWIWIFLTLIAALAQTLRNAAQRKVSGTQGTLPATLVRFVFGLPFAALWLWAVVAWTGHTPSFNTPFVFWCAIGALGQLVATALLLMAMAQKNFVVSVVYSKTEVVQLAAFSWLALSDVLPPLSITAVVIATVGVVVMSTTAQNLKKLAFLGALTTPAALYGFMSGSAFALSIVGYRGAALAQPDTPAFVAGAFGLVCAQTLQSALLGAWLAWRQPGSLRALAGEWRISVAAGVLGTTASIGWLTAVALHAAAEVRALGLVEILFSYAVSRKLLRESVSGTEVAGGLLIIVGVALICLNAV